MIVRVKIRKRNGIVLRRWALHRANDNDSLNELKKSLFDGSSGNECFPSITPPWLQLARTAAVCGMKISDLIGTPMDFKLSEIHSGI